MMADRIAPLSPTDAHPQAAANAARAATPISCMHPNAIQRQWTPAQAMMGRPAGASVGTTSAAAAAAAAAMAYPTLPLCASLYSDAEGRELLPFPCAVSADSYRQMLLQRAPPASHSSNNHPAAPAAHSSASLMAAQSYAAPEHIPLGPSDLSLLCDALLCNSSLTSLSLDHCALDTHALPTLCTLLQQHPSLTAVSLEGNLLGLHPDSEDLRALFGVLASPATLPHLAQLNLANNAPSIQHVDWGENEAGLRGGWAVVDALRERCASDATVLAPVTRFRLECDDAAEHETSASVAAGQLPQPNLAQTRASSRPRPAFWARVQQLLRENRARADQLLIQPRRDQAAASAASNKQQGVDGVREEKKQQQQQQQQKQPQQFPPAPIESLSSLTARLPPLSFSTPAASPSSPLDALLDGSASPPAFLPPALFHASLGRLVSELNRERAARFERSQQLDAALERERSLQAQLESQRTALEDAARKFEEQARTLLRETGHRRELESSLQAARTKEASLVASHARQQASLQSRVDEGRAEVERLHGVVARVRSEAEVERARLRGEARAAAEVAATRAAQESAHAAALRDLERRVEQMQWEREHPALAGTDPGRKAPFRPVTTHSHAAKSSPIPIGVPAPEPGSTTTTRSFFPSSTSRGVELSSQRADRAHVAAAAAAAASAAAASPALSVSQHASTSLSLVPRPVAGSLSSSSAAAASAAAPAAPHSQTDSNRSASSGSASPSTGSRTPLSIIVSSERGSIGKTWAAAATAAATAAAATKAAAGAGPSPLPSGSPGASSSPGGSISSSPIHSPMSAGGWGATEFFPSPSPSPTSASPSRGMFSSGAPPLPAAVLTPTHSMQLLPHHIQSWQQPLPQPAPLKLKPKQRAN